MKISSLLIIFCFFVLSNSFGQRGRYATFQNIETQKFGEENLSSLVWDETGAFWAVGQNGIIKHNGYFKSSFNISDKSKIKGEQIIAIQSTAPEEFWITYGDTNWITKLNPITEQFEHFEIPELHNGTNLTGIVSKVKKEDNGQLWLCTWGNGLIKFNEGKAANEIFIFDTNTLLEKEGYGLDVREHGNRRRNRTETGNDNKPRQKEKVEDAGLYIKDFVISDDGNFLITFFNELAGKHSYPGIFNPKTKEYNTLDIEKFMSSHSTELQRGIDIAAQIIHWAYQDENGKYWLGSYSGLLYLDIEKEFISRIMEKGEDPNLQNQVNTLSYVRSGSELWISTFNKGIMVVDINSHNVNFHYSDPVNSNSLNSNKTNSISVDPNNNIWIINGKGMISIYTPFVHSFKMMYWRDMELEYSNRSVQNIPVNQMYVHNSEAIFVSSQLGLLQYSYSTLDLKKKYQFKSIATEHGRKKGVQHFKVIQNEVFLSFDTYPHILNLENENFEHLGQGRVSGMIGFRHDSSVKRKFYLKLKNQNTNISEYVDNEQIATIKLEGVRLSETFSFVTNQGKWIFSEGRLGVGRFVIYDEKDSSFQLFSPSQKESFFPDSTVKCVLIQERSNEILIGTSTNLYSFDEVTYESNSIASKVGLKENEGVNSMITDNNGNVWLALSSELVCWNPKTNESTRYGRSFGVDVSNFLPAIGQKDELGNLYFATMYGILVFHPDDVVLPVDELVVSLSEIYINQEGLGKNLESFLHGNYYLEYDDNNLEFDFYTNQVFERTPHEYSYQLIGQSERWVSCGSNPKVRLDNLQHGEYELLFKAHNTYGVESETFSIPFTIHKPYWLTWWFFILIGISVLGIVYLVVKGRVKALKKRSEILEQTVNERTAEVVEQKKEAEKQREEAEYQKEIVEEKQKEITDSITYAKRIQDAILPANEYIMANLPNSFVMYRPKDIVAGDFYWIEALREDEVIFAAADCTGHGVPGAMVSVVCNNALNRTVREFGIEDPGKLLDKTRELVVEQFEQGESLIMDSSGTTIKDGMDIALCYLNKKTNRLLFAGANNPLWLIRNEELIETKGDKQPVGKFESNKPFTTHEIQLQKNDCLYIFSDGYADQFGGEKGKKFKSSSLKKLLLQIHQKSMKEQHQDLEKNFDDWKGTFAQLDDVCVIGIEI